MIICNGSKSKRHYANAIEGSKLQYGVDLVVWGAKNASRQCEKHEAEGWTCRGGSYRGKG